MYQPGDVWLVESEQFWISSITSSIPTVTRGWGGTTKATHANATACTLVTRARIDGDDADDSPSTEIASSYNYTQILQRTVNVARTKENLSEYGVDSWEDYLLNKYVKELTMLLNKLPYYGKRYTVSDILGGAGTASIARSAGGLRTFVTDNLTYATSTAATGGTALPLTADHINATFQNIWTDGGQPDLIICGAWAQRKINSFYEGFIMTDPEYKIGGNVITKLRHPIDGSIVDILVERAVPTNELWILSREHIAYYPFYPFTYRRLGPTGDGEKGEVVGEYGFVCAHDKSHGAVLEFSTTT